MQTMNQKRVNKDTTTRIPLPLQSIFLNANRGLVVDTPPPRNLAMKIFTRWKWRADIKLNESFGVKPTVQTDEDNPIICGVQGKKATKKRTTKSRLSPQEYLNAMLMSRSYSPTTHSTLSTAYYNAPSELQLASFGLYFTDLVQQGRVDKLFEALDVGLSPNACNVHGESIVHTACRLANVKTFDVLIEAGCDIQISDDYGRTPLHDACGATEPNFELVEKLLSIDRQLLFLADKRGHLPLSYTRQRHWSRWLQFLESKKDDYWPHCHGVDANGTSDLTILMPHSRPVRDPKNACSIHIARMVAVGKLKPSEVAILESDDPLVHIDDDSDDEYDDEEDDDENDDCSIDICSHLVHNLLGSPQVTNSTGSSSFQNSWNETEMKNILESIISPIKRPLDW